MGLIDHSDTIHCNSWHDADVVLTNAKLPLEVFLPPPQWSNIHLLVTNDLNGLNNGVFFLRVHEWSMWYLSAVMAFNYYRPDTRLRWSDCEQTTMEFLIQEVYTTSTRIATNLFLMFLR